MSRTCPEYSDFCLATQDPDSGNINSTVVNTIERITAAASSSASSSTTPTSPPQRLSVKDLKDELCRRSMMLTASPTSANSSTTINNNNHRSPNLLAPTDSRSTTRHSVLVLDGVTAAKPMVSGSCVSTSVASEDGIFRRLQQNSFILRRNNHTLTKMASMVTTNIPVKSVASRIRGESSCV